jgi:hypothetical protein
VNVFHFVCSLSGGETAFSYTGSWTQGGAGLRQSCQLKESRPDLPGMFEVDELDMVISCRSNDDGSLSGSGFAKQSPGLTLEVFLVRVEFSRRGDKKIGIAVSSAACGRSDPCHSNQPQS